MTYTTTQLANIVGVTERAIRKRHSDLQSYMVGRDGKAVLFSPEVLREFGILNVPDSSLAATITQRMRKDAGKPRGRNMDLVLYVSRIARNYFMADGDAIASTGRPKGISEAVRKAREQMYKDLEQCTLPFTATVTDADKISQQWLYDWITRRDTEQHKNATPFVGAYFREDWQGEWMRVWKKHSFALNRGSVRYELWRILENDFECGEGRGFGRYIFLDDRVSKTYVNVGEGMPKKVTSVCAWDLLSGALLWVERCEEVTSQSYVRCVFEVAMRFGVDKTTWFLENAQAAIGDRLRQFIATLYSKEDLEWFKRDAHRKLFAGQDYIVRNVPSIPHGIGKALGESFNSALRDLDGLLFPATFMGTERREAVQLARSSSAVRKNELAPTLDEYYHALIGAAHSELMKREMLTRKSWTRAKGITASRANMMQYYMPDELKKPTEKQIASLLYHAQVKKPSRISMSQRGTLTTTINGITRNIKHSALYDSELAKYRFSVIEWPGMPGYFAVYKIHREAAWFLCVARDYTATTADEAMDMRLEVRVMREADEVVEVPLSERTRIAEQRRLEAHSVYELERSRDGSDSAFLEQPKDTYTEVHTGHEEEEMTNDEVNDLLGSI